MSDTYTATSNARDVRVLYLSDLLQAERRQRGTRTVRRALTCFKQTVEVIRWFVDGTRIKQLAQDNAVSTSTGYDYLHEHGDVLAAQAPGLHGGVAGGRGRRSRPCQHRWHP